MFALRFSLFALPSLLAACGTWSGGSEPARPISDPAPIADAGPQTEPILPTPSLEDELRAQAARDAANLARSANIPLDAVYATGEPAWWKPGENGIALGRSHAFTLDSAFMTAAHQATAAARDDQLARVGKIVRAAYARLPSGQYIVWAAFARPDDPITMLPVAQPQKPVIAAAPPAPAVTIPPAPTPAPQAAPTQAPTPNPPPQTTPAPAPPPGVAGFPDWWLTDTTEVGGRLTLCAMADAQSERDAQRQAVRAARNRLARQMGFEPADAITHKQETRDLGNGTYRSFVMVSASRSRP